MKFSTLLLTAYCLLLAVASGCAKKKPKPVKRLEPAPVVTPAMPEKKSEPAKTKEVAYIYRGHRFRDPFIPLTGRRISSPTTKEGITMPNLRSLSLKGILKDPAGPIALISDAEGKNFILKEGKLLSPEGKIVPNVRGEIKKDKIIISTAERKIELEVKEGQK